MKKCYASPEMGFEEFRVNRSVAACAPRGQGGFDEDSRTETVQCQYQGLNIFGIGHPNSDTTTLFTNANQNCVAKYDSLNSGRNTIRWTTGSVIEVSHSGPITNDVDSNGNTKYFYS